MTEESKNRNWLIFGIIVVLLTILFVLTENRYEKNKNTFEFVPTLEVNNYSGKSYIDTIVLVTLSEVFEYSSIRVDIYNIPPAMRENYVGYITRNPLLPHTYYLFVDPMNTSVSNINLIAHEMSHLRQYEENRLSTLPDNSGAIFEGDTIKFKDVSAYDRAYEIEAREDEIEISKILNKLIYNR